MQATTIHTVMTQEQHAASMRSITADFMFVALPERVQDAILDYCAGLMPPALLNTNEQARSFIISNYGPLHEAAKQHARIAREMDDITIPVFGTVMF